MAGDAPYAVGVDVGVTNVKAVAVTRESELSRDMIDTEADRPDWPSRVRDLIARIESQHGRATWLGVAAPGIAAPHGRFISWMQGRLDEVEGLEWSKFLGRPVPVLNDAQAALLGEAWRGAARDCRNVAMFTLGTGVGGAIMVDGRLLRGATGRAGHLGHMSLDPDGPPDMANCPGSLEGAIGNITVEARTSGRFKTTHDLIAAHQRGDDPAATAAWLRSVNALAAAVASIVNIADPEVVIIGGGIARCGETLFHPLAAALDRFEWRPHGSRVKVVPATLGEYAGAIGAGVERDAIGRPMSAMQDVIPLLIDVQSKLDDETINLKSLAKRYGYSPFHFHRFFSGVVGETPKQHVDRLRLERAAYKLAITREPVLQIALSVGFRNHETFSRAFKRAFGHTPRDYRRCCVAAQQKRLRQNLGFKGDGCALSDVRRVNLPAMTFLAIRRLGAYAELPVPFHPGDDLWNDLVDSAVRRKVAHRAVPVLICYDDPTVTPVSLQRADACIPVSDAVAANGRIRRFDFAGGTYAGIEHCGPLDTIDQAYRTLADGIRRMRRYVFGVEPPVQIYRRVRVGGDPAANVSDVYSPVRPQETSRRHRAGR